jgi:hypothetical protein
MQTIKGIVLDFDDVIVDWVKAVCCIYNSRYCSHTDFVPADPLKHYNWDLTDICPLEKNLRSLCDTDKFFEIIEFVDGACDYIYELHKISQVQIVSVCSYESMGPKAMLIKKHLPFLTDIILLTGSLTQNKGIIDMKDKIFVDDSARNLDLSTAAVKICFGKISEQNYHWKGLWESNWKDLYERILSYLK